MKQRKVKISKRLVGADYIVISHDNIYISPAVSQLLEDDSVKDALLEQLKVVTLQDYNAMQLTEIANELGMKEISVSGQPKTK